jgi:hypothetical protein
MPNHLNIVLAGERTTGRALNLNVEAPITIG